MTATVRCHHCRAPLAQITARGIRLPGAALIVADTVAAHAKGCGPGALADIHASWGRGLSRRQREHLRAIEAVRRG